MIRDHIGLSVSDYERSKAFSTQALAPLEIGLVTEVQGWARFGRRCAGQRPTRCPRDLPPALLWRL